MIYVALLRGINVGGNNKVDMKILKSTFEQCGMNNVITYINSGNIVFTSSLKNEKKISSLLETGIENDFGLSIRVLVRNFDAYAKMMAKLPSDWVNDKTMKSNVMFLWEEVDNPSVLEKVVVTSGVDRVMYAHGAVLWSVSMKNLTKSGMMKLAGTALYKQMTVRNVNTARKIYELMKSPK